jgi:hypothetical protein
MIPSEAAERTLTMADGADSTSEVRYSWAVRAKGALDVPLGGIANYTWDAYWRAAYQKAAAAIEQQAQELSRTGALGAKEAAEWSVAQRNALVIEMRRPLTPFGQFYSETLKPAKSLPSIEQLVVKKGSFEAVIKGTARTRMAVNKIAFIARVAGPALIVIDVIATVVIIEAAPPNERGRTAAREIGGVAGSVVVGRYGGLAGAWAGVATFELVGSPTLVIPVVGEITEGAMAVVGGVVGFFFGGLIGWVGGRAGAEELWKIAPIVWNEG